MDETAETRWRAHREAGTRAYRLGQYGKAKSHYLAALREAERPGSQDDKVVDSYWDLVELYRRQDRVVEAEQTCQKLLALQEQRLGPEHPDLAGTLHSLAGCRGELGLPDEGESLHRRALAILESAFGRDRPELVGSLHALALHCFSRQRYAEAEQQWKRALATLEQVPTEAPRPIPDVAAVLSCLSMTHSAAGRHADAEAVLRREIAFAEQKGEDALTLGGLFEKMAAACAAQGRHAEADSLYRQALASHERWLSNVLRSKRFRGPERARSRDSFRRRFGYCRGTILHSNAASLRELGRADEAARMEVRAEALLVRALAHEEEQRRVDGLTTVCYLQALAAAFRAQGKYSEAEPLYRRVLAIHQVEADRRLARLKGRQYAAARDRVRETLAFQVAPVLRRYASVLRALGRADEADQGEGRAERLRVRCGR